MTIREFQQLIERTYYERDARRGLATLASLHGIDLERAAAAKYGAGCPRCGGAPCRCAPA
jgi:hypothetical protein